MPLTTIGTDSIDALAITTAKLAADSVTAAKIATGAVGTSEIATDAVDTAEIAANAVDSSEIAADAVTASEIAANAVTTSEILDANVTLAKIADQAAGTVVVRDSGSSGVLSAKVLATTEVLIGNGTGFTAAALSGAITMSNAGVTSYATTPAVLTGSTNNTIPTVTAANAITGEANFTYDGNLLDIKNAGTASSIKLYCENSNAHYQEIKAAPHSGSTSWTLTLPPTDGAADEFLQTDGAGATTWASAAGGLQSVQAFTSGGTWTKPAGITKVWIRVLGAGAGGGGMQNGDRGGGGGGGGYAEKFLDVSDITTSTVTIGALGTGGAAHCSSGTPGTGVAGGLSSFVKLAGSGSFTDVVGNGGASGGAAGGGLYGFGGLGGTATGGDVNIQGGIGGSGWEPQGGNSTLGQGGQVAAYENYATSISTGYGAGGIGGYNSGCNVTYGAGRDGTGGIIIVLEYA